MSLRFEQDKYALKKYVEKTYPGTLVIINKSAPNLIIDDPRGSWFGLRLEILDNENPFRPSGMLRDNPFLREKWKLLMGLCNKGYFAGFSKDIKESKLVIDWYMSLPITNYP